MPHRCAAPLKVVGAANGDFGRPLGIRALSRTAGGSSNRQWIDFRHDVTAADIELAARENFSSVEHMKRYTTTGMSIDQGKTSNLNVLTLLADLTSRSLPEVGTTTFRPLYSPVAMGTLAGGVRGNLYAPARLMPGHDWHIAQGGELEDYGAWKCVACYPRPGETREQAITREVHTVRNQAGLFDGSPLGKIDRTA